MMGSRPDPPSSSGVEACQTLRTQEGVSISLVLFAACLWEWRKYSNPCNLHYCSCMFFSIPSFPTNNLRVNRIPYRPTVSVPCSMCVSASFPVPKKAMTH